MGSFTSHLVQTLAFVLCGVKFTVMPQPGGGDSAAQADLRHRGTVDKEGKELTS